MEMKLPSVSVDAQTWRALAPRMSGCRHGCCLICLPVPDNKRPNADVVIHCF